MKENHMPSVFRRFLRDSFYFQFPMLKIRTFYSDAGQLVSATFNPDTFPPFKEILKILSQHPLSYVYIQWEHFLRILPFNLLNEFAWLNFVSAPLWRAEMCILVPEGFLEIFLRERERISRKTSGTRVENVMWFYKFDKGLNQWINAIKPLRVTGINQGFSLSLYM